MLLSQKTFSLVIWEQWSAHDSQPHRRWLAGIARKISCLLQVPHQFFGCCYSLINIVVMCEIKGDLESQVFEVLCKVYLAIHNCNSVGIGGCVIEGFSLLLVNCREGLL
jgi:hypothetical protein